MKSVQLLRADRVWDIVVEMFEEQFESRLIVNMEVFLSPDYSKLAYRYHDKLSDGKKKPKKWFFTLSDERRDELLSKIREVTPILPEVIAEFKMKLDPNEALVFEVKMIPIEYPAELTQPKPKIHLLS